VCAFTTAVVVLNKIAAAIPESQDPHLYEDYHPLASVAREEPKGNILIARALAKELLLSSISAWGGEQPGTHCHSTRRKVLGLATFTGRWTAFSFRISMDLLPRHNQPKFHYHSFQTCNSRMVLFTPHLIKQKCRLNFSSKNQDKH